MRKKKSIRIVLEDIEKSEDTESIGDPTSIPKVLHK